MKASCLSIISILLSVAALAQDKLTFGVGYFGETTFHPGIIIQTEYPNSISSKLSVPLRIDMGYYFHKRNHQAWFSEIITGFRCHFGSRWYTGINGGIGLMSSWHHSDDGVYELDENGIVSQTSSFAGVDFMPSVGLEFAYQIKKGDDMSNYIFLRPKAFWQINVNEKELFHYVLELGYAFTITITKEL